MKLLHFLYFGLTSAVLNFPQPDGPFGVSLVNLQVNDTNRRDPYTGKPYRLLPVTIISPTGPVSACKHVQVPYLSNATAKYWEKALGEQTGFPLNNTFSQVRLSLCEPYSTNTQFPLMFFSPGLAFPTQFYNLLTTNIAAQGYVVVAVGNPGEIPFIQFPDGQIERSNISFAGDGNYTLQNEERAKALDIRVKDLSFVLDQLSLNRDACRSTIGPNINTSNPFIAGHSFGGPTALAALIADSRFSGGANEDGAFWGDTLLNTTDRPFMIIGSTPNDTARDLSTVPNWAETWPHLEGAKWLVSVKNTTHDSYTDVPLIAEALGLFKYPGLTKVLGAIDPKELLKIEVALLTEMAKYSIGMVKGADIRQTAREFKEAVVVNGSYPT